MCIRDRRERERERAVGRARCSSSTRADLGVRPSVISPRSTSSTKAARASSSARSSPRHASWCALRATYAASRTGAWCSITCSGHSNRTRLPSAPKACMLRSEKGADSLS
eukprot:3930002-Prymnesium_polylepis.1